MPAKAGIQSVGNNDNFKDLDSRFRGNDNFFPIATQPFEGEGRVGGKTLISILKWKNRMRKYIRETVYFYSENTVFSARREDEGLSCGFMERGKGWRNFQLNENRIADIFHTPKKNTCGYFRGDHETGMTTCVAGQNERS